MTGTAPRTTLDDSRIPVENLHPWDLEDIMIEYGFESIEAAREAYANGFQIAW